MQNSCLTICQNKNRIAMTHYCFNAFSCGFITNCFEHYMRPIDTAFIVQSLFWDFLTQNDLFD